jgi:hypothetical protein
MTIRWRKLDKMERYEVIKAVRGMKDIGMLKRDDKGHWVANADMGQIFLFPEIRQEE